MKTPRSDDNERWEQLVQQARADTPPPVNLSALLCVVNAAAASSPLTWIDEFLSTFAFGRAVSVCVGGIGTLLLFTSWQVWDCWHSLAWAQLLVPPPGGVP